MTSIGRQIWNLENLKSQIFFDCLVLFFPVSRPPDMVPFLGCSLIWQICFLFLLVSSIQELTDSTQAVSVRRHRWSPTYSTSRLTSFKHPGRWHVPFTFKHPGQWDIIFNINISESWDIIYTSQINVRRQMWRDDATRLTHLLLFYYTDDVVVDWLCGCGGAKPPHNNIIHPSIIEYWAFDLICLSFALLWSSKFLSFASKFLHILSNCLVCTYNLILHLRNFWATTAQYFLPFLPTILSFLSHLISSLEP